MSTLNRLLRFLLNPLVAAGLLAEVLSGPAIAESKDERMLSPNPQLSVIARAPDFTLRDLEGRRVSLSDYRGRVTLLAFIFTNCKSVCPLISQQMALLQAKLGKRNCRRKKQA